MALENLKKKIDQIKKKSDEVVSQLRSKIRKKNEEEWDEETEEVTEINPDETEVYEDEDILDEDSQKEKKNRNIRIALGIIALLVLSSDYWLDPLLFDNKKPSKPTRPKETIQKEEKKETEIIEPSQSEQIEESTQSPVVQEQEIAKEEKTIDVDQEINSEIQVKDIDDQELKAESQEKSSLGDLPPEVPAKVLDPKKDLEVFDFSKIGENIEEEEKEKKKELSEKEKSYIAPPNYHLLGRGLVYNCKEKYWACVGKISYFQCGGHQKWSEEYQESPKCVTSNVYSSVKDCETVQAYYVDNNEPTDFCQVK